MDLSKDDLDFGAVDQGIMFEYATDETENGVLLTGLMATRLEKKLSNVRENGDLWRLRPHGKTQVTIEHVQGTDGSMDTRKIHTVVTGKYKGLIATTKLRRNATIPRMLLEPFDCRP